MKIFYLLVLVIFTATGCQTGSHQLAKSPLELDNVNNRSITNSLKNEIKEQKSNPDIEKFVQIIKEGKSNEQVLFAYMAMKLGEKTSLLSISKTISTAMDVTLYDMANAMSNGFKKVTIHFQDGKIVSLQRDWTQGDLKSTGNQLDLAIFGNGFFRVINANGDEVYTRDGSFKLSNEGYIVTLQEDRIQPEISIPTNSVAFTIDASGTLEAFDENGATTTFAQLTISNFINPSGLNSLGKNYYSASEASGDPVEGNPGFDGLGIIAQGFLEMSNVFMIEEMVRLQKLQSWKKVIDRILLSSND